MTSCERICLNFYVIEPGTGDGKQLTAADVSEMEPAACLFSNADFQLKYALEDLTLQLERCAVPPGRYPVRLEWSVERKGTHLPILGVSLPGGRVLRRRYSLAALRCEEELPRLLEDQPDLATPFRERRLLYSACPAEPAPVSNRTGVFQVEEVEGEPEGGLHVRVNGAYPVCEAVDLEQHSILGKGFFQDGDLPVVCPADQLLAIAQQECGQPSVSFVESGWHLLGRVFRNGADGDLVLQVEDVVTAVHTERAAGSLVFTLASKLAISEELRLRNVLKPDSPLGPLKVVGWVHTHHFAALGDPGACAGDTAEGPPAERAKAIDSRQFSSLDEDTHRLDFGAASVALVLDAGSPDSNDLERIYAVYGTVGGEIVRRGLCLA